MYNNISMNIWLNYVQRSRWIQWIQWNCKQKLEKRGWCVYVLLYALFMSQYFAICDKISWFDLNHWFWIIRILRVLQFNIEWFIWRLEAEFKKNIILGRSTRIDNYSWLLYTTYIRACVLTGCLFRLTNWSIAHKDRKNCMWNPNWVFRILS